MHGNNRGDEQPSGKDIDIQLVQIPYLGLKTLPKSKRFTRKRDAAKKHIYANNFTDRSTLTSPFFVIQCLI